MEAYSHHFSASLSEVLPILLISLHFSQASDLLPQAVRSASPDLYQGQGFLRPILLSQLIYFFTGTITSINFLIFTIRAGDFKTCLLIADPLTPSVLRSKSQRMYKERSKKVSGNIDFDSRSSFQVPIRTHSWVVHKGTGYGPSHW